MPESFADDWGNKLPPTAVYGTPNNEDNGIPGEPGTAATKAPTKSAAPASTK
jgi:hypothetical protein